MPVLPSAETPKMTDEMFESLKAHILRQREKRKQEQEQDAAMERHRREQELKRKRDALSLQEIKDQLVKLEVRLKQLKEEKHELFLQLKKVLNEDETRKKQRESELLAAQQQAYAAQQVIAARQQQVMSQNQPQVPTHHPFPGYPYLIPAGAPRPPHASIYPQTIHDTYRGLKDHPQNLHPDMQSRLHVPKMESVGSPGTPGHVHTSYNCCNVNRSSHVLWKPR